MIHERNKRITENSGRITEPINALFFMQLNKKTHHRMMRWINLKTEGS